MVTAEESTPDPGPTGTGRGTLPDSKRSNRPTERLRLGEHAPQLEFDEDEHSPGLDLDNVLGLMTLGWGDDWSGRTCLS